MNRPVQLVQLPAYHPYVRARHAHTRYGLYVKTCTGCTGRLGRMP